MSARAFPCPWRGGDCAGALPLAADGKEELGARKRTAAATCLRLGFSLYRLYGRWGMGWLHSP